MHQQILIKVGMMILWIEKTSLYKNLITLEIATSPHVMHFLDHSIGKHFPQGVRGL